MTLKELIRFTYGLIMGTSTPFLKPTKRYLFRTQKHEFDGGLGLFLGGSGICGVLVEGDRALVINTNQQAAASEFRSWVDARAGQAPKTVILNSLVEEFAGGLSAFADAESVLVPQALDEARKERWSQIKSKIQVVDGERVISIGDERVRLIPMGALASSADMVVFLENRSVLFAGALFFNRLHPILRPGGGLHAEAWVRELERLMERLQPKVVVPAEGDLATGAEVKTFLAYLRDLQNPAIDFSTCRKNYDWPEIPSLTSLEENFDLLREKVKSHTTLH